MKIIASTVLVALFAAVQGRFLDAATTAVTPAAVYGAYASTLQCGSCIGSGNTYCIQKAENTVTNAFMTGTTQQTCIAASALDTKLSDATWSCSNAFNDRVYSKYVCQYNTVACGSTTSFSLANTTSTANFNVSGLALGQTCFYKVQAACGGPSFKPNVTDRVEIEYVEFRAEELAATDIVVGYVSGSMNMTKRASAPVTGQPRRDHFFKSELGGNLVSNANSTTYNASVNGTVFGRSGRYDKSVGGRKAYGNPTQGDTQTGILTNQANADCSVRNLYLAITATTDNAALRVDLSSVAFYRPPAAKPSGANILSITFAAVLGLISLAFF